MRYLLDTNALISTLNDTAGCVAQRLKQYFPADIGLSSIFHHRHQDRTLIFNRGYILQ